MNSRGVYLQQKRELKLFITLFISLLNYINLNIVLSSTNKRIGMIESKLTNKYCLLIFLFHFLQSASYFRCFIVRSSLTIFRLSVFIYWNQGISYTFNNIANYWSDSCIIQKSSKSLINLSSLRMSDYLHPYFHLRVTTESSKPNFALRNKTRTSGYLKWIPVDLTRINSELLDMLI